MFDISFQKLFRIQSIIFPMDRNNIFRFPTSTVKAFRVIILTVFFSLQMNIIDYVSQLQENFETFNNYPTDNIDVFDYIIVGGGAAGSVLANRLSENPANKVLLFEIGGDPNPFTIIPALTSTNLETGSKTIENIQVSVFQPNACFSSQGNCSITTGRGLGGTTNINGLVYTRGSPQIYDKWSEITGDDIWSYQNVLKYFKKSENYHGYWSNLQTNNKKYHSTGGEWYISNTDRQDTTPALDYFMRAAKNGGYRLIDPNNGEEMSSGGYGHFDFFIKDGQRWGTYKAFLQPILGRRNLKISKYSRVIKIHFDNKKRAKAVSYIKNGKARQMKARTEIILSGGTFGSAELLMLSGIGQKSRVDLNLSQKSQLESFGIPVVEDLPVGKTLVDHFVVSLTMSINKTLFFYPERDTTINNLLKYLATYSGYFGKAISDIGFIFTKSSETENIPDLELAYSSLFGAPLPSVNKGRDYFGLYTFVLTPKSKGNISLKSKNITTDNLFIDPKYLSNPMDLDRVVHGMELLLSLIQNSDDFKALDIKLEANPACAPLLSNMKEFLTCHSRNGVPSNHFVGTCQMGKYGNSVVDSKLRVYGVHGLRVVDASVIPLIPNAHPTAPIVMIGELASDLILNDQI